MRVFVGGWLLAVGVAAATPTAGDGQSEAPSWMGTTRAGTAYNRTLHVYGKYFKRGAQYPHEDNAYSLFVPQVTPSSSQRGAPLPVVLEFHGGGYVGGSATWTCSSVCEGLMDAGIAFASFGYRLVDTRYVWCPDNSTTCADPREVRAGEIPSTASKRLQHSILEL